MVLWNIFSYNWAKYCALEFVQEEKFVVLHSNSFYEASFKEEDAEASTGVYVYNIFAITEVHYSIVDITSYTLRHITLERKLYTYVLYDRKCR